MEPLGVINYVKSNLKRLIATIIIVSFSSFLLYFTFGIGSSIKLALIDGIVDPYKNMTIFYAFKEDVREMVLDKLRSINEVDKVVECSVQGASIDTIVGKAGVNIIKVNKDYVKLLLEKMDLKLVSGTYCEKDNEIIVNERVLRAMNKRIGDYVGDEVDEKSSINGKYKITGVCSGKSNSYIVSDNEINKKGSILIFGKNQGQEAINRYLNTLNKEEVRFTTLEYMEDNIGNMKPMLYGTGTIVCIIFVIVLAIIMWNIIYINMMARKKEIALIKAVGYSNKFIKGKLFKEHVVSFLMASVLGSILGLIGLKIFYEIYCYPRGFGIMIFSPVYLIGSLMVPCLVLMISVIPISRGIRKIEPISILEGNV